MTQEEKERIDYEIKAKREAREKEIGEWVIAVFKVMLFLFAVSIILKAISSI